jgi:flavin reductase (DIM6/NTAB) family NADH-FMN oxidoreductase RutF
MPVDQQEFRSLMGHFATGVTILTTHDGKGTFHGLTANAICSVSLVPPLLLCCIDKGAESYPSFAASGVFTVNILSSEQETLSRRFAKSGGAKFDGVGYRLGRNGAPILNDVLAHAECEVRHAFEAGDHTIYLGEPLEIAMRDQTDPLLFFRGGYRNIRA